MKRLTLFLIFAFGLLFSAFAQDRIRVEFLNGREYYAAIDVIGRMTVSDNVLRIYAHSGQLLVERSLSDIDRITFGGSGGEDALNDVKDQNLRVYPNPTQEVLFVEGVANDAAIRLFSVDGRLLETLHAEGQQVQMQVVTLPRGIYLLQVGTDIIRFIKD